MKTYLNLIVLSFAGLFVFEVNAQYDLNETLASAGSFVPDEAKKKANKILWREVLFPLNYNAVRPFSRVAPAPIKERQFSHQLTSYEPENVTFKLLCKYQNSDEKILFATGFVDLKKEQVFFRDEKKDVYVLAENYRKFVDVLPGSSIPSIKIEPAKTTKTTRKSG
ncbi:hypothetical protein [Rubellicoccus peritrichatus]|uniref:Uncharacterized protein n=1 Tax=Rubellicoccus peritrichatus TaxID=3080537 RepID=A0AAQ3QQX3_9BACT|nr:hypothetical protein [Puniceicoccus sp. CR14]WOO40703.1 hypothetical protein RZN69_18940 [Puniceicoccus sp. CR14]